MQPPNSNHSTSKEYELLIHRLIEQKMTGLSGVDLLEIRHDAKMKGLSGYEHQIDVLYRFRIWKTELLVIVECKQYQNKVGIQELLEFRSRIDDLRAHKGIFVTTAGYQSGAIEFAEANRIALLLLRGTKEIPCEQGVLYSAPARGWFQQEVQRDFEILQKAFATHKNAVDLRMHIGPSQDSIVIHCDGAELVLFPGELRYPTQEKEECNLQHRHADRIFFHGNKFRFLRPEKILTAVILEVLLCLNHAN